MVTEYPGGMSHPINENSEPAHRYGQVLSLSMSRYRLFRAYRNLTQQQFRWLMEGLTTNPKKAVRPSPPPEYTA